MKKIIVFCVILSFIIFSVGLTTTIVRNDPTLSEKTHRMLFDIKHYSYNTIKNASSFAVGGVGRGPSTPDTIYAYASLLKSKNAKNYFVDLLDTATNEGKLYALCGLYTLDRDLYNAKITVLKSNKEEVLWQSGCVGSYEQMSTVISNFEKNHLQQDLNEYIKSDNFNR